MSIFPIMMGQGRHAARHRRPVIVHITRVEHVASCALFACTCLITGPLRADDATAQADADTHLAGSGRDQTTWRAHGKSAADEQTEWETTA